MIDTGPTPGPREVVVPTVTVDQMQEVDRLAVEEFGVQLIQIMENTGRSLAHLARRLMGGKASGRHVIALVGAGNNGGGAMAAARHLANWGTEVQVLCAVSPQDLRGTAAMQGAILERMGVPVRDGSRRLDGGLVSELAKADLVLDGLVGYGLKGSLQGAVGVLLNYANLANASVLSLDVPSGVDATTGESPGICVRALATLTLALPKRGLARAMERGVVGVLYLTDIGIPQAVYERMGLAVPRLFAHDSVVELKRRGDQWCLSAA